MHAQTHTHTRHLYICGDFFPLQRNAVRMELEMMCSRCVHSAAGGGKAGSAETGTGRGCGGRAAGAAVPVQPDAGHFQSPDSVGTCLHTGVS